MAGKSHAEQCRKLTSRQKGLPTSLTGSRLYNHLASARDEDTNKIHCAGRERCQEFVHEGYRLLQEHYLLSWYAHRIPVEPRPLKGRHYEGQQDGLVI